MSVKLYATFIYVSTHTTQQVIPMPNMTLSIPSELHTIVKHHTEIKWSEVARRAMWEQARRMHLMDKLVEKSKFTEKDVTELDHKIKKGLLKRFSTQ